MRTIFVIILSILSAWTPVRAEAAATQVDLALEAGREALRAGELTAARAAFEEALRLRAGDVEALYNLASIALAEARPDDALGHYRVLSEHPPERSDAYFNIGVVELQRGKVAEAMEAFVEVVSERPDYPRARLALAEALEKAGLYPEALEHNEAAARLVPSDPLPLAAKARILGRMGRRSQAMATIRQARRLAPDDEDLKELARALRKGSIDPESAAMASGLFDSSGGGSP